MKKSTNIREYKANRASLTGERLLSLIVTYLIAITLIMLIGLINKDGVARGFPFPWLLSMRYIIVENFIPSLLVVSAAVVGASFIAAFIKRVKEPKLIAYNKAPNLASNYAETIEMAEVKTVADSKSIAVSPDISDEITERFGRYAKSINQTKTKIDKSKKNGSWVYILVAVCFIISLVYSLIDSTVSSNEDYFDGDDEIVLDADNFYDEYEDLEYYGSIGDAVVNTENLFFNSLIELDGYESVLFTEIGRAHV